LIENEFILCECKGARAALRAPPRFLRILVCVAWREKEVKAEKTDNAHLFVGASKESASAAST
jgi:hypothetical protein